MKKTSSLWLKLGGSVIAFFALLLIFSVHNSLALVPIPDGGGYNRASAYNPIPGSGTYDDNSLITPYLVVGNNQQSGSAAYRLPEDKLQLYVKKGSSITLDVFNAGPACHTVTYNGLTGPDYSSNSATGGPMTWVQVQNSSRTIASRTESPYVCQDQKITLSAADTNAADPLPTGVKYAGYNGTLTILIWVISNPQNYSNGSPSSIQGENSFRLDVSSGSLVAFGGGTTGGYGFRDNSLIDGNTWDSQIPFGVTQKCPNPAAKVSGFITYKDADGNNTTWNPKINFVLQEIPWSDNGSGWKTIATVNNNTLRYAHPQTGNIGGTTFDPAYRYRILLNNVGVKNTVFIELSSNLDQISTAEHLTASDCTNPQPTPQQASCSAAPFTQDIPNGGSAQIDITGYVNSGKWPSNYYIERTGPSYRRITQNGQSSQSDNVRPPPNTITTYTYLVYDSQTGKQAVNSGTCVAYVRTSGQPQPSSYGSITMLCKSTVVSLHTKATDTYTTTTNTSYQTTQAPANLAQYPNGPSSKWVWSPSPPPNAGSNPFGLPEYQFTGTVTTQQTDNPAREIPYLIKFINDSTGAQVGQQKGVMSANSNGDANMKWDTFKAWAFLQPHNIYTAQLSAQVTGTFQRGGPYEYTQTPIGVPSSMSQCLEAKADQNQKPVCVGGSGPSVEVSQQTQLSYIIQLTNNTDKTFGPSFGYNMLINISPAGSLQLTSSASQGVTIPPGTTDVTAKWNAISNYQGSFYIVFRFNNTPVTGLPPNGTWNAICPGGPPNSPNTPGSVVTTTPYVLPYFQVWDSSISSGGGFRSPGVGGTGGCGGASDPPYVWPGQSSPANQNRGGIEAFAKPYSRGSRADFGAVALGLVPQASGVVGFYSGVSSSGHQTVFANSGVSGGSGYLNSNSQAHCVNDYFTDTRTATTPFTGNLTTGQYTLGDNSTFSGGTIHDGQRVTIYVNGSVNITGNINYDPSGFNPNNPSDIPYFALIAKGNIMIDGSVTHLDGLYVAQPNTNGSGGELMTCNPNNPCTNQLVINGAVIAQHVELLRNHGSLTSPPNGDVNGVGGNPAEVINFVPSMIIGAPNFAYQYGTLEGIYSLPPVF